MKKVLSRILVFSLLVSAMASAAVAVNVERSLNSERNSLHESIKSQLIEQDALYLMDYFDTVIDDMLSTKYGIKVRSSTSYYAPNGGTIKGTGTHIEVEACFFNVEDTVELYDSRNDPNHLKTLLEMILGAAWTPIGVLFTLASICNQLNSEAMWRNIDVGNEGCCMYSVYDTMEDRTTTVAFGWTPPYMSVNSTITVTGYYINPY